MEKQVAILLLALLFFSLITSTLAIGYTDVTVTVAKAMIDSNPSLVLLDVRSQSEYNSGHIRNAKLIPHTELAGRLDELNINDVILVYCLSGGRSSTASQVLADNGFLHVYNMLGGIAAWKNAGYIVYIKYSSIQQAINNANEGDTLYVSSGTYYENVVANKTVSLIGENRNNTIIDGSYTGTVLNITAENAEVAGFTMQNSGTVVAPSYCGILVASNSTIRNNIITNNSYGISLLSSSANTLYNNLILDNSYGVYLAYSINNDIHSNILSSNENAALSIQYSSNNNSIHNNIIFDNEGGMTLQYESNNNNLTNNNILGNTNGITIVACSNNIIFCNNFIENDNQVLIPITEYANHWDNGFEGNYWSNYNGTDSDSDGIGDSPYVIDGNNTDNYPLMSPYLEGDVNHDGVVELMDFYIVSTAFGSTPSDPNWNPHADINGDGMVELTDFWIISWHFGESW